MINYRAISKHSFIVFAALLPLCASAQNSAETTKSKTIGNINNRQEEIIEPDKKSDPVHAAQIDTERFELGLFLGALNVEDFNTNMVWGASFTYHITLKVITQAVRGQSRVDKATFEELADGNFLADSDYDFTYTSLLGGYRILHGRSFLGSKIKMNSSIYLLGGLGQIEFADNNQTSFELGVSYRTVVTDWLTFNVDFRDHIFDREFIDVSKTTHNTEIIFGFNALF